MNDIIGKRIISSASAACSYMFQAGKERAKGDKAGEESYTLAAQEAFDRILSDIELLKSEKECTSTVKIDLNISTHFNT